MVVLQEIYFRISSICFAIVAEQRLVIVSSRILTCPKQIPPRFASKWGAFHCSSFSFSLLNNLSAISVPSLIGSAVLPISLVANTSAESLMKSTSLIYSNVKATLGRAYIVPKGKRMRVLLLINYSSLHILLLTIHPYQDA